MSLVPADIVRRFLSRQAGFGLLAETKAVPASIAKAVDTYLKLKKQGVPPDQMPENALPPEVLIVWQYVVDHQGPHFQYAGALKHWRNKCAKDGIPLTDAFVEGLGGKGSQGDFKTMTGEQVDDWVKATLKSEGMIDEAGQSALRWKLEIAHYQREVEEAQARVEKHMAALAAGKVTDQRKGWLEGAQADLATYSGELDRCKAALDEFTAAIDRHKDHHSPTVQFEREFQFMLQQAMLDFSKQDVLKAAQAAIERFNEGLEMPAMPGARMAGLGELLSKAWKWVSAKWAAFVDWFESLSDRTVKINDLLDRAGA